MVPNGRSRREIGGPTGEDGLSAIALEGAMHRFHMLPGKQGQLLSGLEEVEREILKRRFGLDGRKAMSLEETARDMGLDPEEAAAREREAMCALRNGKG